MLVFDPLRKAGWFPSLFISLLHIERGLIQLGGL